MPRTILAPIAFLLAILPCLGFTPTGVSVAGVNWMTWEEAMEQNQDGGKKMFVHVYTDYCTWCKKMDEQTFQDPVVASYINKNFLPVRFNAEHPETITFKGKEYKFVPNKNSKGRDKGYHELVLWMTNGRIQQGYPTDVFISEKLEIIQSIPGFIPAERFEAIMTFFGDDHYKNMPWGIYLKKYEGDRTKAMPASEGSY